MRAQMGAPVPGKAPSIAPPGWTVVSPMPTAQDESFSGSARKDIAAAAERSIATEQMWAWRSSTATCRLYSYS